MIWKMYWEPFRNISSWSMMTPLVNLFLCLVIFFFFTSAEFILHQYHNKTVWNDPTSQPPPQKKRFINLFHRRWSRFTHVLLEEIELQSRFHDFYFIILPYSIIFFLTRAEEKLGYVQYSTQLPLSYTAQNLCPDAASNLTITLYLLTNSTLSQ